jgi:hypothetical protein
MFSRALEAVCRDVLSTTIMLRTGIKMLKDKGVIDDRLYDWSQQLRAFCNLAAHPDEGPISQQDAEDLQSFVYAIIEYVYDLTDKSIEYVVYLLPSSDSLLATVSFNFVFEAVSSGSLKLTSYGPILSL